MAVDLNTGAMYALDPRVQLVLGLGDVAFVRRRHPGIGNAERHSALGKRAIDSVLRGCAQPDPLVAEPRRDSACDHCFENAAVHLVADTVQQIAARTHLLQRKQVAALVVDARQAVADELLRDVREPVATTLDGLVGRKGLAVAGIGEYTSRAVRHP